MISNKLCFVIDHISPRNTTMTQEWYSNVSLKRINLFVCQKSEKLGWLSLNVPTQSTITCSNLTIETLEQGVKYVQS